MAIMGESDIVSVRFWKFIDSISVDIDMDYKVSHRIAFLMLFLHLLPKNNELHNSLINHLDKRYLPENISRFEFNWVRWLAHINSEQVIALAEVNRIVAKALGFEAESNVLDRIRNPEHIRALLMRTTELVEQERNHALLANVFDYGFMRDLSSAKVVDNTSVEYVAALASSLVSKDAMGVGDFFGASGQFAVNVSLRLEHPIHCLLGHKLPMTLELSMRFLIYGISSQPIQQNVHSAFLSSIRPPYSDLILLAPPSIFSQRNERLNPDTHTAIGLAEELVRFQENYRMALLVVPKADTTKRGRQEFSRRSLIENNQVLAVIDLPKAATTRVAYSCWLIRGKMQLNQNNRKKILFVDGGALSHLTESDDISVGVEFIARLISLVIHDMNLSINQSNPSSKVNLLLEGIFTREFENGYHDVRGLCRLLPVDEVIINDSKLVAKEYLSPIQADSWLSGLEWGEVQACLDMPSSQGRTIYIIGNNGEGKSILLRDFASRSVDSGRRTVAIALGTTDRFHFKKNEASENYIYLGSKTSASNIDLRKTAISAGRLMLKLHEDIIRIQTFNKVAEIIGFSAEHFLIPSEWRQGTKATHGLICGVIRLSSSSLDDIQMLDQLRTSPAASSQYKLGLRRVHDNDAIIPFDELSSGEQQIILLASKIISYAESGALFLIDEPEISLHVSWQRAIPLVLSTIARQFEIDILVATHSPVLVASAVGDNDYCFTAKDRTVRAIQLNDRQSVETVLFEGFRTHTSNNREVHERCASLVATCIDLANQNEFQENQFDAIFTKLDDMRGIVERGAQALGQEKSNTQADLNLISKSKAAINELVDFLESERQSDAT